MSPFILSFPRCAYGKGDDETCKCNVYLKIRMDEKSTSIEILGVSHIEQDQSVVVRQKATIH